VCESILRDATNVVKEGKLLCKFYLIWKLPKSANAAGIRTRPIAAAIDCITGSALHFLEFLDLDICVEQSRPPTRTRVGSWYLTFKPDRKPGNAHAYIPFTSFNARHAFRGWVLEELLRILNHSSTVDILQEEGEVFYHCPSATQSLTIL
jgi:hypothetical protein